MVESPATTARRLSSGMANGTSPADSSQFYSMTLHEAVVVQPLVQAFRCRIAIAASCTIDAQRGSLVPLFLAPRRKGGFSTLCAVGTLSTDRAVAPKRGEQSDARSRGKSRPGRRPRHRSAGPIRVPSGHARSPMTRRTHRSTRRARAVAFRRLPCSSMAPTPNSELSAVGVAMPARSTGCVMAHSIPREISIRVRWIPANAYRNGCPPIEGASGGRCRRPRPRPLA